MCRFTRASCPLARPKCRFALAIGSLVRLSSTVCSQKEDLIQFIIHAALDCVEQKVWSTTSMYLKNVDKFNDIIISAFVTAGRTLLLASFAFVALMTFCRCADIKFMLLHDQKTDENAIKSFFADIHELYIKV
jgi:hypothetical protein